MEDETGDTMEHVPNTVIEDQPCSQLIFGLDDRPPIHITLLYGLQILLTVIAGPVAVSVLIHKLVCAEGDDKFLGELMSASLFNMGVATIMQVTLGLRLPTVQGSSLLYVLAVQALMNKDQWKCPETQWQANGSVTNISLDDHDLLDLSHLWRPRLLMVSGGLMVASIFHFLLGALGIVGILSRYIGPLTVASELALIGVSFYDATNTASRPSWPVAIFTVMTFIIVGIIFGDKLVPIPVCDRRRKCTTKPYPLFKIFALNIAMATGWLLCFILTVSGVFSAERGEVGYYARADSKINALYSANWFYVPYPGHFGVPTLSIMNGIAFMTVALSSTIESVGDYFVKAHVCEQPRPPAHAINRGIAIEGLSSIIGAATGICHGTTSYCSMIGLITSTGAASRFVYLIAGVMLLVGGVICKFGAFLAMVPEPVIGGTLTALLAMIFSSAINVLQTVEMTAPRNQLVLGLAVSLGVAFPVFTYKHGEDINTGSETLDSILFMCLTNGMMIGVIIAFCLDNLLPGTLESRGMRIPPDVAISANTSNSYDIPYTEKLHAYTLFRFIPCLPCFHDKPCTTTRCWSKRTTRQALGEEDRLAATGETPC